MNKIIRYLRNFDILAEVLLIKAVLNYSQNVFLLTMLYNQKKHTVKSVITQRPNYSN
jgi:hypothetical protein